MGLKEDLTSEVKDILGWNFEVTDATGVPTKGDLTLGKTARRLTTAVLYVDVRNSSKYPEEHRRATAAKIFNAYLNGAVRIIRSHKGEVRSFNGDSVLAFFDPTLDNPASEAVSAAMHLSYFVDNILLPQMANRRYTNRFDIGIGIAYGDILVTKAGIRGDDNNDLIWPATATNLAAKLGDAGAHPFHIWISEDVFNKLPASQKFRGENFFFREYFWTKVEGWRFAGDSITVYKSKWSRRLD